MDVTAVQKVPVVVCTSCNPITTDGVADASEPVDGGRHSRSIVRRGG